MNLELFGTAIAMLGLIGAMFKFMWSRLDKKFDKVYDDLGELKSHFDKRCDKFEDELKEIKLRVTDITVRINIVETRLEERKPFLASFPRTVRKPGRPPRRLPPPVQ